MKRIRTTLCTIALISGICALQSCINDGHDYELQRPTALVTVRPSEDGSSFSLQLDNATTLYPSNVKASPYGKKEVRALINYTEEKDFDKSGQVHINWMDSIRTKAPVPYLGEDNDTKYGNDPIEIVRDWVTVAEDGYLTLRIRTVWGNIGRIHYINLLTGSNPEDPFELELRHDARNDTYGELGDALIAFNLNDLPHDGKDNVKLKLKWKSFSGPKSAEFDLHMHQEASHLTGVPDNMMHSRQVQ